MSFSVIFPGQGSQHVGMGKFLYDNFPSVKERFEEASDSISLDLKKLCFEGPEDQLTLTENTQPALLLTSYATFEVLKANTGFSPLMTAGHSIGEYAAVVAAGSLNFADGVRAVRERGQAMQSAVPVGKGGMAAVMGLSNEQVTELCEWAKKNGPEGDVEPANFNSPGQVVISGHKDLIDFITKEAKADLFDPAPRRLKLIPLKVSAPFHSSLMKPAEEHMERVLGELQFSEAQFPVVQNIDAKEYKDGAKIRENLVKQVRGAVLWTQCVETMKSLGGKNFIECGPGKVLAGLVKKIDSDSLKTLNINSLDELKAVETAISGQ